MNPAYYWSLYCLWNEGEPTRTRSPEKAQEVFQINAGIAKRLAAAHRDPFPRHLTNLYLSTRSSTHAEDARNRHRGGRCAMSSGSATAVSPNAAELANSRQWAAAKFEAGVEPFFSFTYDGKPSSQLLKTWEASRTSRTLDDRRTEHTIVYTDPTTGLVLRCVAIEYRDYPTVEWTLYFKNTAKQDSPILADIQALDIVVHRGRQGEFLLHHHAGSQANSADYQP